MLRGVRWELLSCLRTMQPGRKMHSDVTVERGNGTGHDGVRKAHHSNAEHRGTDSLAPVFREPDLTTESGARQGFAWKLSE